VNIEDELGLDRDSLGALLIVTLFLLAVDVGFAIYFVALWLGIAK